MRLQGHDQGCGLGPGSGWALGSGRACESRGGLSIEALSARLVGGPLSVFTALVCIVLVASWLPNYLAWPWWADLDAFGVMAHSWDSGVRPYRDITAYNFPGTIYAFWILGRLFGWSQTWPIFALDAALLLGFGAALVGWSRRILGLAMPGWIGFLTFLLYYLSLDWTNVAQRDWHCACFAVAGLLVVQTSRGLPGEMASALLFALGLSIRPHAVFFLPAAVVSIAGKASTAEDASRARFRPVLRWLAAFAAFTALLFLPLLADGLLGDFFRSLQTARSRYSGRSGTTILRNFLGQLSCGNVAIYLGLAYAWGRGGRKSRPLILAWGLATAAAFGYRLIAPVDHLYLRHPLRLAIAVDLALVLGIALESSGLPASAKLWLTFLLAGSGSLMPGPTIHSNIHASSAAIDALRSGRVLEHAPPGGRTIYPWGDYQRALRYLRDQTRPGTRVANLLRDRSPAVCGPTGRLPVFPVETPSLDWLWINRIHTEADFIAFLERAEDSVVVWSPEEPAWYQGDSPPHDALAWAVRRLYAPAARFGAIEIWTRKNG